MCWMCDHPGASVDDYLDHLRSLITSSGWIIQGVQRDGNHPPFAYTIGLTGHGHPELVITGMDTPQAAHLLNSAASRLVRDGDPDPVPGSRIPLDGGSLAEIVTVAVPDAHLNVAAEMYGDRLRAVQLVHADEHGRWPWDPAYRGVPGGQPVLGPRDG